MSAHPRRVEPERALVPDARDRRRRAAAADRRSSCSACWHDPLAQRPRWPRFLVAGLHRNVTLLAVAFVVVHVVTTVADGYAPIRLATRSCRSSRRTGRSGSGSGRSRSICCSRWSSRACCARGSATAPGEPCTGSPTRRGRVALVHALGTGSDARGWTGSRSSRSAARPRSRLRSWCRSFGAERTASPAHRRRGREHRGRRAACSAGTDAARLSRAGRHGPARRRRSCAEPRRRRRRARSTSVRPCRARRSTASSRDGWPATQDGAGDVGIAIGGNVTGGGRRGRAQAHALGLRLRRRRRDDRESRHLPPVGLAGSYSGQVVGLDGNLVQADVTNSSGDTLRLTISLRIDSSTGSVTGTVDGA